MSRLSRIVLAAALVLNACGGGSSLTPGTRPSAQPTLGPPSLANVVRISADPFTNGGSQHATQVEPAAAAFGLTVVAAFQSGRFFSYGSSDIGFATSVDGGVTWQTGTLPGTTHYALPAGPYDSVSDPSVAYDRAHALWLIASLPVIFANVATPGVIISRSPDGLQWSNPVALTGSNETTNDKSWIACDNHPSSPHYGRCYVEWDSFAGKGAIFMSSSYDGGTTWTSPSKIAGGSGGISGIPVVQPNGTVVVPIDDANVAHVIAFSSRDGGVSWSAPLAVAAIADHAMGGGLRGLPFVTAAADAGGKIYVVWQDCRFRTTCGENDLVLSTSEDGITWTTPQRIPIDSVHSSVDHFLPGLSVDPSTQGTSAHLAVSYYSYSMSACSTATCELFANVVSSPDGGASWNATQQLAGPFKLDWIAQTMDGPMVGDYTASAFISGRATAFLPLADPSRSGVFDEALYVPKSGLLTLQSERIRVNPSDRPVPGFHSDHPPRTIHP